MKIVGLITEYNPFHNGHQFHIEKAKEVTGADYVIVVMSGNFVQRGMPAIMPKHMRAEAALKNGASLVIELPVCYATETAEQFAYGAVSILHKLGCVDSICFGSECGDIKPLQILADIFVNEPSDYKTILQDGLRNGLSFPAARQNALSALYPDQAFANVLDSPNNILAIEYLKAIKRLHTSIQPYTIKREMSNYHDAKLTGMYSSATAIRDVLLEGNLSALVQQIPCNTVSILQSAYKKRYPITANDFSFLLKYRLLQETNSSLVTYADISEELANRICKTSNCFISFEQYCGYLKTKEITYSRISRALLHILLHIKKTDYAEIEYARVLGFRKKDESLLSILKQHSSILLLTKLGANQSLSDSAKSMLNTDIFASNLYESVITEKYQTSFINEHEHPIVRI